MQTNHTISDAGIIFLTVEDPYSRITRSISKCEYSAIGFYAPSTSTGVLKVIVTLVDLFGVEKPTWLSSGCTLDKLIHNPLVTRLAVRPLKVSSNDHKTIKSAQSRFRACICRGIEMVKKPTPEETVFSLFGFTPKQGKASVVTGIDLVNQVITLYGAIDKIQPGNSISLSTLDELHRVRQHPDPLSVIGMMGMPFAYGEESVDISSYIVDTELFGEMKEIPLPKHDPSLVETAKQKTLDLYRPELIKSLSTFVDLLLTHPDFFSCVLKRLKAGQKLAETSEKILLDSLSSFSDTSEQVLSCLYSGNIDEIKNLLGKIHHDYFSSCLYLDKEPKNWGIEAPKIKKEADLEELKNWTQELILLSQASQTQIRPICIDMTRLVAIVNRLTHSDLSAPSKNLGKIPAFLDWSSGEDISLERRLQSGKVIYLDKRRPELENLSSEELIEISHSLNELDESYDHLREAVCNQLSSLHDVGSY